MAEVCQVAENSLPEGKSTNSNSLRNIWTTDTFIFNVTAIPPPW
jgi:hypothetical protein